MPAVEKREVKMYSDYKSPFAYLAFDPAFELEKRFQIRIRWIPFQLRIKGKGERSLYSEHKARYSYLDARRWAKPRGLVIRGPMHGREHAYVLVRDWLGESAPVERERALAELARRYLAGHAPAEDRDLAYWAGLPLRDARAGLTAIASELHERPDGLLELKRTPPPAPPPPPRLLGSFDPVLHGWRSREAIVGDNQTVVTANGIFRPIALVQGRAVATWSMPKGRVELRPFGHIPRRHVAALEADADEVLRYLAAEEHRVSA